MGKCVFKEYSIKLHGKCYRVLTPGIEITEMWVELWETIYKNSSWSFAVLDRTAFKYLRDAYIALAQNPYWIIYFPIRNVERVKKDFLTEIPPEFVLYTHQLQLNRREWKEIKRCMKYTKPQQCVVRFYMPDLYKHNVIMMRQWTKKKSYYPYRRWKYRDEEKVFYQYETCFIESSIRQALYTAIEIQKAMEGDLETKIEEHQYLLNTARSRCGGISYEFATKNFLKRREKEEWKYVYEDSSKKIEVQQSGNEKVTEETLKNNFESEGDGGT